MIPTFKVVPGRRLARILDGCESVVSAITGKRFLPVLILLAGLLPSSWLLYELRDAPQFGVAGDDIMYVGAAQSLANELTYRESALPGDPWQTKYPPGYPLMLAAILKLNPNALNFWIIAHSWTWLAVASVTLAWTMRQAGLTPVQASIVGALWVANPASANVGILALADAPYCAILFLVLGLVLRLNNAAAGSAALAGLAMGVACLIRSAGIVAIGGLVVWLVWRRSLKTALWFGAAAGVLPAFWMLWSHAHLPPGHGPVAEFYFSYVGTLDPDRAAGRIGPNTGDERQVRDEIARGVADPLRKRSASSNAWVYCSSRLRLCCPCGMEGGSHYSGRINNRGVPAFLELASEWSFLPTRSAGVLGRERGDS